MQKINKKPRTSLHKEYDRMLKKSNISPSVIILDTMNMPTKQIQALRDQLKNYGTVIKSKKRIMMKALEGYDEASFILTEKTHLFFVERDLETAIGILQNFSGLGYLKPGDAAPKSCFIAKGILKVDDTPISTTYEKMLVECNVPVLVKDDVLLVEKDFCVCNEGDVIDSKVEKILKTLKIALLTYKVNILSVAKRK